MEAQVNAWIILAVALVAVGLLITLVLWLRAPHSAESEYVTVAELRARLENEQEPADEEVTEQEAAEEPGEHRPDTGGTEAGADSAAAAGRPAAAVVTPPTATDAGPEVPPAGKSASGTGDAEPTGHGRTAKEPTAEPPPEDEARTGPAEKPGAEQPPETGDEPPAEKPDPTH
ncbi:hypothetical protein ABZV91_21260 [Nocardia sp. NPDC004568]|uniref:hypothetical protein n=1 Tax=Nocardia sp. NPDC004568 TaxID=3154551 RepID=UPI0033A249C5